MFPDCDEPLPLVTDPSNGIDCMRSVRLTAGPGPATPHNRGGSHSGSASAYGDA
ncbi:uncharacterized protein HfgLR_14405 [Haloferax gibbonsii]|uniref:Uncharacterized protein n=1 Tax=Haloferax gibbonsii TaxID=35746 RepID=A0A871BJN5_HALGI|nr:uncharacterized protein HfgLR_14405 [Haloferax gibbonsii]